MRSSEANKAWKHLVQRDRGFAARRLSAVDKLPLANFTSELPNGLVVVCGLNGVGKTTLLRLVFEALGGTSEHLRDELRNTGSLELVLEIRGDNLVVPTQDAPKVPVSFLDAAGECNYVLSLARQPNFEDLADGFDSREWTEKEIAEARFVVGKPYTAIRSTEIEAPIPPVGVGENDTQRSAGFSHISAELDDEPTLALIEVEADGSRYDFRTMGQGELAALTLLWRLRQLPRNAVVLLEEPETYLSARASAALLDVLARTVNDRHLYAFVTTHSPGLIRSTPLTSVRVLMSDGGATKLREPTSSAELEYILGLPSGPVRVVLVEDHTALDVISEIVRRYAEGWVPDIEYLICGGEEPLLSVCRKFPRAASVQIVGVLDGDQAAPNPQPAWPVLTLPGPQNPDLSLRAAALADIKQFADLCGRDLGAVSAASQVRAGDNEHDWFHSVSADLGLDVHGLRRAATKIWADGREEEARELVQSILSSF